MEKKNGRLFDLAPDGLGFIAEAGQERIWAFDYYKFTTALAATLESYLRLEGKTVLFVVEGSSIISIQVEAAAAPSASSSAAGR